MTFYDVHLHNVGKEKGGILIGLEGEPKYEGVLSNSELENFCKTHHKYFPCYYITKYFNSVPCEKILKYHPFREQYSPTEVIDDLSRRNCKICIIDTLNSPQWQPLDYHNIVRTFPNVKFILAHMGGYDILEFVKILEFNKNVYADFSLTQEYFGWCGSDIRLQMVIDLINYCFSKDKLRKKVLFGSDHPFYSQDKAINAYIQYDNINDILINNYNNLLISINTNMK